MRAVKLRNAHYQYVQRRTMLQTMAWQGFRRRNSTALRRRLSTYAVPMLSQASSRDNANEDETICERSESSDLYEESSSLTRLRPTSKVGMIRRAVERLSQKKTNRSRRLGRDISKDISKWEKLAYRLSSASKVPEMVGNMNMWKRVLDPDGNWCYNWMGIVTLGTLYNVAVIILRLAFSEMRQMWLACFIFGILDIICDSVYVADIWVQSRISYHEDGCLIEDLKRTSKMYRKQTRFKLDVASIFPLYLVASILFGTFHFAYFDVSFVSRHYLFTPLTRIPRLLKVYTISSFFDATDCRTSNPNSVRAFKLSLYLCLVIHWIGCLYYILSEFEGLGSTEWVYNSGKVPDTFSRKYIRCIYWSLLILTTIGERPPPETDLEYIFTGMTFVIGVFIFAAVVGNVGDVISNLNASRQEFQARMDQIKFYMQHRQVPVFLQDRVKRWAQYTWARTQAIDEPQLLQMLPERLQMDVAIQVHLDTLKKVKIFEECEEGLLRELVLKLRPQIYSPGDYICHIGDIGREMFIINHGKIEIIVPNKDTGQRTVVANLGAGNYFGEISLLKLDAGHNRRTADVRSVGYSELLCLSRKDLMAALVEYPNAKNVVETQARERMRQTLQLRSSEEKILESVPRVDLMDKHKRNKRESLLDVIKSDGFKQLLKQTKGGSDMSDVQTIVAQLKDCHAQALELTKQRASDEVKKLEKQLQHTQDCLKSAYVRISEMQMELGKRSTRTSKSVRKFYNPHVNGNDGDQESTSLSSASSPRKLSNNNKYLSDHCLPDREAARPVRDFSLPRQINKDTNRQGRDKDAFSRRSYSVSENCLKRIKSTIMAQNGRLIRQMSNIQPNNQQPEQNDAALSNNNAQKHSSVSKLNEHLEPARQSSGYSSDTETVATLMRVSNALRSQRRSWASSSESSENSDWDSEPSMDRRYSDTSTTDLVFSPTRRESAGVTSNHVLTSHVNNRFSPSRPISETGHSNPGVVKTKLSPRKISFSLLQSSNRKQSNCTQSKFCDTSRKRPSVGGNTNRQHTSTPNLSGIEERHRNMPGVPISTTLRKQRSSIGETNVVVSHTDKINKTLNASCQGSACKGFNYRETNV